MEMARTLGSNWTFGTFLESFGQSQSSSHHCCFYYCFQTAKSNLVASAGGVRCFDSWSETMRNSCFLNWHFYLLLNLHPNHDANHLPSSALIVFWAYLPPNLSLSTLPLKNYPFPLPAAYLRGEFAYLAEIRFR
eukprot:GHVN01024530.1.p3 GENE.GHVN01024530.1~~GHVN01024530.1.p3  ORF type:complete len:134 (+),score=5.45 GHVN01024530.1:332-733(+)